MTDPHDIASDLPAPREDEPESLRSDIIDELADHLQCAAAREQFLAAAAHEPADPPLYNEIRDRVLARFGNPAAVARRLWWDAMQETVMGQRFSLVMQGLMAAAVVMMCVFVWRMITDNARTQAALIAQLQQAQSELLNSQRESNALLAERLSALAVPSGDPIENSDWLPLSFRLVDEAGSPVAGSISISTEAGDVGRVRESLTADANGNVDFGLLPPNWYIWTATAADIGESASATILLGPGRTDRFEIVCPTAPPEPVDLTVQIEMPQAYAGDPIYHVLRLSCSRLQFAGRQWNAPGNIA